MGPDPCPACGSFMQVLFNVSFFCKDCEECPVMTDKFNTKWKVKRLSKNEHFDNRWTHAWELFQTDRESENITSTLPQLMKVFKTRPARPWIIPSEHYIRSRVIPGVTEFLLFRQV